MDQPLTNLTPNAATAIVALKLWHSPNDDIKHTKEEAEILYQLVHFAPTFVPHHVFQLLEDGKKHPTSCGIEILGTAAELFGHGFCCKVIDEDEVLDKVLIAYFMTMEKYGLVAVDRDEFRYKYIQIDFSDCGRCDKCS